MPFKESPDGQTHFYGDGCQDDDHGRSKDRCEVCNKSNTVMVARPSLEKPRLLCLDCMKERMNMPLDDAVKKNVNECQNCVGTFPNKTFQLPNHTPLA